MATQSTIERLNPSKLLYWAVGLAVIIILGIAFSMMRERNLSAPRTDRMMTPTAPTSTPEAAPLNRSQ